MGTPDYISPEQVRGKRGDCRSDIYALGVMLYEMLTGQVPFEGDNPLVVMNARLRHDPQSPREIDPEISLSIENILFRALARDPKERYASAQDLALDHKASRAGCHVWPCAATNPQKLASGMDTYRNVLPWPGARAPRNRPLGVRYTASMSSERNGACNCS